MTMKPLGLSLSGIPGPSPERIRSDLLRRRRELYGLPDVVGAVESHAYALRMVAMGVLPRSVLEEYFGPAFRIFHADALALLDERFLNGTADRPPVGIIPTKD